MTALLALVLLLAPQESAARLRAGQEKVKVRDFDGAIPEFERCLELAPDEYNASFGLGVCLWEKESYAKARAHFRRVVELVEAKDRGASLPGVHQKLLGCALLLEDFDAALEESTRMIEIQATADYYLARATAKRRKGDLKGALEDADGAVKEDPLQTRARSFRASVLLALADEKGAMEGHEAAIQAKASDPAPLLARACAHYRLEHWAEAQRDLQASLKLNRGQNSDLEDQGYGRALLALAQLRAGTPLSDPAGSFKKVLKDLNRDPAKNHFLALPLFLAGELSEAQLIAAAEAAPGRKAQARCEALFFAAERRLLEGDKAGARTRFQDCVATGAAGVLEHDLAGLRLKALPE